MQLVCHDAEIQTFFILRRLNPIKRSDKASRAVRRGISVKNEDCGVYLFIYSSNVCESSCLSIHQINKKQTNKQTRKWNRSSCHMTSSPQVCVSIQLSEIQNKFQNIPCDVTC